MIGRINILLFKQSVLETEVANWSPEILIQDILFRELNLSHPGP